MLIKLTVAVPLFFQLIAGTICPGNQTISSIVVNGVTQQVNTCAGITPDGIRPDKVDIRFLDMVAGQYMKTQWTDSSTMLTRVESLDGSCYSWLDDDWQNTSTCEFSTNP